MWPLFVVSVLWNRHIPYSTPKLAACYNHLLNRPLTRQIAFWFVTIGSSMIAKFTLCCIIAETHFRSAMFPRSFPRAQWPVLIPRRLTRAEERGQQAYSVSIGCFMHNFYIYSNIQEAFVHLFYSLHPMCSRKALRCNLMYQLLQVFGLSHILFVFPMLIEMTFDNQHLASHFNANSNWCCSSRFPLPFRFFRLRKYVHVSVENNCMVRMTCILGFRSQICDVECLVLAWMGLKWACNAVSGKL